MGSLFKSRRTTATCDHWMEIVLSLTTLVASSMQLPLALGLRMIRHTLHIDLEHSLGSQQVFPTLSRVHGPQVRVRIWVRHTTAAQLFQPSVSEVY